MLKSETMTQLSNDCFASGPPVLSVDEAVALIAARVGAVEGTETVPLHRADGRVLAADLVALLPLPRFTKSAVDGYAVASADLPVDAERALPVSGRIAAGAATLPSLAPGHAVRIFTGAPLPAVPSEPVITGVTISTRSICDTRFGSFRFAYCRSWKGA